MKKINILVFLAAIFLLFTESCIKSTLFGDEIIQNDEIGIAYIDTTTLKGKTVKCDSLLVYPNYSIYYLLGELNNPITGKAQSSLFCNFYSTYSAVEDPDSVTFDSIVLTMNIDTSTYFGKKGEEHHLEVYELEESFSTDSLYSDDILQYSSLKAGELDFIPGELDSLTIIEPGDDTITYTNIIRIKLDDDLGKRLLQDTAALKNDTLFNDLFKGFYIKSTPVSNSMFYMMKRNDDYYSRMEIYYSKGTKHAKITFLMHNAFSHFDHDYSNAEISQYFDDETKADSFLFIQGMAGSDIKVSIPDFEFLKDKVLNKAELNFYTVKENENFIIDYPQRLLTYYTGEDGEQIKIEDLTFGDNILQNQYFYFGYGTDYDEEGVKGKKYILNITLHLKEMIEKGQFSTELTIKPERRTGDPGSAKFYGFKSPKLRARLKLLYSNKN